MSMMRYTYDYNGMRYTIDAPAGATAADLEAIVSGGVQAAPQPQPAPPPQAAKSEDLGFFDYLADMGRGVVRSAGSTLGAFGSEIVTEAPRVLREGLAQTIGSLPGLGSTLPPGTIGNMLTLASSQLPGVQEAERNWAKGVTPAAEAVQEAGTAVRESVAPRVAPTWQESEGFWGGLGSLAVSAAESSAPTLAALTTGVLTRNPRAAMAVMGLTSVPQTYSGIRQQQAQEGIDDVGKAVLGTAASSALDILMGEGSAVANVGRQTLKDALESGLTGIAKRVARTGTEEGVTESLQNIIEQVAGGADPTTKQSLMDTLEAGLVGAVSGAGFGGATEGIAGVRNRNVRKAIGDAPALHTVELQSPSKGGGVEAVDILSVPTDDGAVVARTAKGKVFGIGLDALEEARVRKGPGESPIANILQQAAAKREEEDIVPSALHDTYLGLFQQEVARAMQADPALTQPEAVRAVGDRAGELLEIAKDQIASAAEGAPIVDTGVDVSEGLGAVVPPAGEPVPAATVPGKRAAPAARGMGEAPTSVQAVTPSEGAGEPALATEFDPVTLPIYEAPKMTDRKAAAKPIINDIIDTNYGDITVPAKVTNQIAAQMAQRAARKEVFNPTEIVQSVLTEAGIAPAPAPAPVAAPEAPAPVAAPEAPAPVAAPEIPSTITPAPTYTPQQIVENIGTFAQTEAEDRGLDPAMFREGVRDIAQGREPLADQQILDAQGPEYLDAYKSGMQWAQERFADLQAEPEAAVAPEAAPEAAPEEDPYAGVLADAQVRLDRGHITPEGLAIVQERVAAGREAQQAGIETRYTPEAVSQALERITTPDTGPEVSPEGNPEEEKGYMTDATRGAAANILNNFMVGDRVRVGSTPGIVVGLDGDYVRVHPDSARNPKAYNRIPKSGVEFVSRPDDATTVSASKVEGQDAKFGEEAGQLNADMAGLVQLLGANMYASNVADVSVKELLQNAFDAVKGAVSGRKAPSLYTDGKIQITLNSNDRTITVKDNARGMTPEIVRDAFFTVAGSDKSDLDPQERSGGLGLAKMGFMMGADWLKLDTVRDGVRVTVDATSKEIASSDFKIKKAPAPAGEHGTTVTVKVPETYTDPKTGEAKTIWFPYSKDSVDILTKPLIGPVEVEFTYDRGYGTPDTEVLPMGVNFPYDNYQKLEAKFDWGTADIYYGKERKKYPHHQVLSSGVYQFNERFKLNMNEIIPYDIIVNIKSDVDAKHPDYPFENSRERFKGRLDNDIKALSGYLAKIARGAEAADLKETMQNVISMPRVEVGEDVKGLEGKLKKSFDTGNVEPTRELPQLPTEVRITDMGVLDAGGRMVWDRTKEEEKKKQSTFEAKEAAPTRDDFMIELDQDPANPIFHNNTNFDPLEAGAAYGDPAKFFAELGSLFVEMKEMLADSGRYGYDQLKPENFFYSGIGIDKQYGGLHIRLPYKAVLVNPFYDWGARTLAGVRMNILNTMIHELAHTGDMDHGVGHNTEMIKVEQYLADEGMLDYFRDAIMDLLLRHESTYTAMRDAYGRSTTQNIAKSLEDYGKQGSASREDGRTGAGREDETGAVPAGGGRRGRGNIQAASQADTGRGKRGGSGKVANLTTAQTVAATKLTKAQTNFALQAAGLKRQKADNFQRKIVQSRNATEMGTTMSKLAHEARSQKDGINTLKALTDSVTDKSLVGILTALSTDDITRWVGDRIKAIPRISKIIEDVTVYRLNRIRQLAEDSDVWTKFNAEFEEGGRALGDVMHAATFYDVDPSLAPSAADYMQRDAKLQGLIGKGAKPAEISRRKNEIRRIYDGGVTEDGEVIYGWNDLANAELGAGKAKAIYRMARDRYRKTFNEHYDLLMARIEDAQMEEDDAERAKDFIEKLFEEARKKVVYFPLMRHGRYWLSVGKGKNSEFYLFESATARNKFRRTRQQEMDAEGLDLDMEEGDNIRELRANIANKDASVALKNIFETLQGGSVMDMDLLKDHIFQMYLQALPESDMRKRFTRRQYKAGFSTDTLRNFIVSQHTAANQLARLAHASKLRNTISAGYAELKGNPKAPRLRKFLDEVAIRAKAEIEPEMPLEFAGIDFDKVLNAGNKLAFIWLLTSPKSALIQMTQLHVVGLPVLSAEFGEAQTMAAAARYGTNLILGRQLSTTKRNKAGDVITEWGEPSIRDSKYISSLKDSDPDLHKAMVYGWNYANDRDMFMSTYAADMTARGAVPSGEYGAVSAMRRGQYGSAAWQGTKAAISFMSAGFHHMERINRETMYMSTFEMAYKRAIKQGKKPKAAQKVAAELAAKLTYEAMFNFSNYNKPRIAKFRATKLGTNFLTYSASMTSYLVRNFYGMLPKLNKEGKVAATRKFFGTLGMTFMYAGVTGLPLYSAFMALLDGLRSALGGDDDDDEFLRYEDESGNPVGKLSTDYWFRTKFIPETFGTGSTLASVLGISDETAEVLARAADKGPISAVTGLDIGSSTSLDNLWFSNDIMSEGETAMYEYVGRTVLGPTGAVLGKVGKALSLYEEGHGDRALETLLPAFFAGGAKASRFAEEGVLTKDGKEIKPAEFFNFGRLFGQTLGFANTEVAQLQKENVMLSEIEKTVTDRKTSLVSKFNTALGRDARHSTPATRKALDDIGEEIDKFNDNFPYTQITPASLGGAAQRTTEEAAQSAEGANYNPRIPAASNLMETRQ